MQMVVVPIYQPFDHRRRSGNGPTTWQTGSAGPVLVLVVPDGGTCMRFRPVRPNIYLPVIRFGVQIGDWKYILVVTLVGYLLPFIFRLRIGFIPLWFVSGIGSAAISYAFFRYTKVGRKPNWFQHSISALLQGPIARRTLAIDRERRRRKSWLLTTR